MLPSQAVGFEADSGCDTRRRAQGLAESRPHHIDSGGKTVRHQPAAMVSTRNRRDQAPAAINA
jgi:hypothetical protein